MVFGVLLKAVNNIYFGEYITLIFEFVPQLLYLTSVFG